MKIARHYKQLPLDVADLIPPRKLECVNCGVHLLQKYRVFLLEQSPIRILHIEDFFELAGGRSPFLKKTGVNLPRYRGVLA
jgi:hypothetical protein